MIGLEEVQQLGLKFIDGTASEAEVARLSKLLKDDSKLRDAYLDLLEIHSALSWEYREQIVELEKLPGEATPRDGNALRKSLSTLVSNRWRWNVGWLTLAASIMLIALFVVSRDTATIANAAPVIKAAMAAHAEAVERVYSVTVDRSDSGEDLGVSREITVNILADRFWLEISGFRDFSLGKEPDGSVWIAVGSRRGMRIESDEIGPLLRDMTELYSLQVETLLADVLRDHEIEKFIGSEATYTIVATPKRFRGRIREVSIELDKKTNAVTRLEFQRRISLRGYKTITFELIDSRPPDESQFSLAGQLAQPFRIFTRDMQPDRRLEVLKNWVGPMASGWIKNSENRP